MSTGSLSFNVKPQLDKAVTDRIKAQIDELAKSRDIKLNLQSAKLNADLKAAEAKLANLSKDRDVKIKARVDSASAALAFKSLEAEAKTSLSAIAKDAQSAGKESGGMFSEGFSGIFTNPAVIGGGVIAGLAVLPGAVALSGAATGIALGAAIALSTDKTLQAQAKGIVTQLKTTMANAVKDSGFSAALAGAMTRVSGLIKELGPQMTKVFGNVAPLLTPVVNMFGDLAKKALPGFISMLNQAKGPLAAFFNSAGKIIGTNLGAFFRNLGPAVGPSLSALTSILRIVTGLLPPIAALSGAIAKLASGPLNQSANGLQKLEGMLGKLGGTVSTANGAVNRLSGSHETLTSRIKQAASTSANQWIPGLKLVSDWLGRSGNAAGNAGSKTKTMASSMASAAAKIPSVTSVLGGLVDKSNAAATASDNARKAWSKYIGTMTGSFGSLQTLQDDMTTLAGDIQKVKGSFDGNSKAARQYHADLDTAINDADGYIGKLKAQAAAAGNTKGAQDALSEGIKGTIAQLIPAASHSATARAEVLALARANGINASSFADLTSKVGSSKDATQRMTDATGKLTGAAANATGAQAQLKAKIDKTIDSLHLGRKASDDLKSSIQKLPAKTQVDILEQISGKGSVQIQAAVASAANNAGVGSNVGSASTAGKAGNTGHRTTPKFATGGLFRGRGSGISDSNIAAVSNGEFITNAHQTRKHLPLLKAINEGKFAGAFATGGLVNHSQTGSGVAAGNRSLIPDTVNFTLPYIKQATESWVKKAQQTMVSQVSWNAGAGVQQWAGLVKQVLALEGMNTGLVQQVLRQIQTESGGNPNAQNNWDINAQHGDPSRGLLQVIGSTFAAWRDPRLPNNILNPASNIAAALRYAAATYGPSLMSGGNGLGSGHGYFGGGTVHGGMPSADKWNVNVSEGEKVLTRSQAQKYDKAPTLSPGDRAMLAELKELRKHMALTEKNTRDTAAGVGGKNPAIRRF